ncbi:MAG: GNAT family N-acetyltransferase [Candidatus Kerfeldbacteria bacterium]|nr:GNAT family N-acetyltransferase [Candidatus Kerfeldbacteria bacterium]
MKTSQLYIRRGELKDLPLIKQCLIDSWVEHARHEPALLDEERMRNSQVEEYYESALTNSKNIILVAESQGKFAGFVRANKEEIPSFFKNSKTLFIDDICVLPEYRKHGVGRNLLQEIEKLAKGENIRRLQCRVYTFNVPSQRLFQSMGYSMPHSIWDKSLE